MLWRTVFWDTRSLEGSLRSGHRFKQFSRPCASLVGVWFDSQHGLRHASRAVAFIIIHRISHLTRRKQHVKHMSRCSSQGLSRRCMLLRFKRADELHRFKTCMDRLLARGLVTKKSCQK